MKRRADVNDGVVVWHTLGLANVTNAEGTLSTLASAFSVHHGLRFFRLYYFSSLWSFLSHRTPLIELADWTADKTQLSKRVSYS